LQLLVGDIKCKKQLSNCGVRKDNSKDATKDNVEGWVDEQDDIDVDKLQALDNAIQPVCFLLTKVSHLGNLIQALIIKNAIDPQTCIYNQEFHHLSSPSVVSDIRGALS
jgi:hypothetical protein